MILSELIAKLTFTTYLGFYRRFNALVEDTGAHLKGQGDPLSRFYTQKSDKERAEACSRGGGGGSSVTQAVETSCSSSFLNNFNQL